MCSKWIVYNASMLLISRCNKIFSKNFIFKANRSPVFSIRACLTVDDLCDWSISQGIEIFQRMSNEGEYLPSLIVRFYGLGFEEYEKEALKELGFILGKDIANRIHIPEGIIYDPALIFDLDPNLNYEKYKIQLDYISCGEKKTITTDYPFAKYLNTEFELELMVAFNDNENPVVDIARNGKALFDYNTFIAKPSWGIMRIQKKGNTYEIILRNMKTNYDWCCNDTKITNLCVRDKSNDNYLDAGIFYSHILSYIGQLSILEITPCLPQPTDKDPYMDIYMSSDYKYVIIDRIRNYSLTPNDIKAAIPYIINTFGGSRMDIDWSRKAFLAFLPY